MTHPDIRVALGFLYDAYTAKLWWFEIVDMANKLFLVSIVGFFPPDWQLGLAMVRPVTVTCLHGVTTPPQAWTVGYLMVLLLAKPYVRKGDDRLHLLVQLEIYLFLLAGTSSVL